jgi:hypothetical protein
MYNPTHREEDEEDAMAAQDPSLAAMVRNAL